MRKWIPIMGILLAFLLVLLSVGSVKESAVFDAVSRGDSYSAQAVSIKDRVHLYVWENATEKQDIIRVDSDRDSFAILQVAAGNPVLYQYSYKAREGILYYGVESYNPEKKERHILAEWEADNTQWLAFAGVDGKGMLRYATWDSAEKQLTEYEANTREKEINWVPVRNIKLDVDATVFGNYDKDYGLQIGSLEDDYFYFASGSSHSSEGKEVATQTFFETETEAAEKNPTFLYIRTGLEEDGILILLVLLAVILMLFGVTHRQSLIIRMYSVFELVLLAVIIIGCICVKEVVTDNRNQILFEATTEHRIRCMGILFFVGATALVSVTLFLYQKRWQRFVDTAHSTVVDKTGYSIPKKDGRGMDVMWGSLQEMSKNVEKLDYERQRSVYAYSRFIPENLSDLFGKESLTEVPAGYLSYKTGTMVRISMESLRSLQNNEYLKYVNSGIGYLREKAEYYKAVVIGTDPDDLKAKCFFKGGADAALAFAVDMAVAYTRDELLKDKSKTMLINSSEYCCGVAGTEEMAVPFLYSAEDELLFSYEENLRRAGVQIVMTEAVLNRLTDSSYSVRYIGYIRDVSVGRSLKLYECMDAYTESERKRMVATLPVFEKALNLFYSDDFYLARNTFNKVLQMNPADRIARWYLFDCEYYLNKTDASEVSYALYDNPMIEQQYQK